MHYGSPKLIKRHWDLGAAAANAAGDQSADTRLGWRLEL